jgi:hypothetical protein
VQPPHGSFARTSIVTAAPGVVLAVSSTAPPTVTRTVASSLIDPETVLVTR